MRTRRAFTACLAVIGFVALSTLAYRGVTHRVVTGTVVEFRADKPIEGRSGVIAVINDGVEPHPIALRGTKIDGRSSAGAIGIGTRVTVWCRYVGESRLVADRIRVLPAMATH
jgi:hypothetical protein